MQKLLGKLSLKTKLQILTFIPLAGLLYFIITTVIHSYHQTKVMEKLSPLVKVTNDIATLVNEQEIERTYTAGFISSDAEMFGDKLLKQREKVSNLYANTLKYIQNMETEEEIRTRLIKQINDIVKRLTAVRAQISKENIQNTKANNALNFYTSLDHTLLETLLLLTHYSEHSQITSQIMAYYNILATKDDSELIRSYGLNTISELDKITDDFDNSKNILYGQIKLKSILSSEALKLTVFLKIVDEDTLKFYNELLKKTKLNEYNEFVRSLSNDEDLELYQGEGESFFKLATKKVTMIQKVEKKVAINLQNLIQQLKKSAQSAFFSNAVLGLIVLFITLLLGFLIHKRIGSDMHLLKTNLLNFFDFISKKTDDIQIKDVDGNDEFAILINTINQEVTKTKEIAYKDNIVLKEIDETITRVENGFFSYNIKAEAGSDGVKLLKNNVNNMINTTKDKLDTLRVILEAFGQYQYDFKLSSEQRKGMAGDIGTLSTSLLALGEDISIFMATFSNVIDKLNSNTNILLSTSSSLSNSSNQQAASLEETAASVEEVTSIIQLNANNINQMGSLSDNLKDKASVGNTLAHDTSNAMKEINEKIQQITEAISVIDQIAFQTNILSLNAAVEAATAGEAGKGFAVVAGEVRNLASRSSEAANEIKSIVEIATTKAIEGQKVSSNMIEGYNELNSTIGETKEIIDTVAQSSENQRSKILQINEAISQIDHMTQENAKSANNLNKISNEVEKLSNEIEVTISQAKFDQNYKMIVCDPNLAHTASKYKRDHISFKNENFKRLNEFTSFQVTDYNNCKMGQWMKEQEEQGNHFTTLPAWDALKQVHEKVHKDVQSYIDSNAQKISQTTLEQKALQIESDTLEVFEKLNLVLQSNCKQMNK
jgi:methyl-accepting chemotaxis protein